MSDSAEKPTRSYTGGLDFNIAIFTSGETAKIIIDTPKHSISNPDFTILLTATASVKFDTVSIETHKRIHRVEMTDIPLESVGEVAGKVVKFSVEHRYIPAAEKEKAFNALDVPHWVRGMKTVGVITKRTAFAFEASKSKLPNKFGGHKSGLFEPGQRAGKTLGGKDGIIGGSDKPDGPRER